MSRRRTRLPSRSGVARRAHTLAALVTVFAVIATAVASPAAAYWTSTGSGSTSAATSTLSPPTNVTVPAAAAPNVSVSWTAGTGVVAPNGYFVTRTDGTTTEPACASSPTTLVTGTTCNDLAVPDGTHTYVVTAVFATWTAPSQPSGPVVVENATQLVFVSQPTDTLASDTMTPDVTVAVLTADGGAFTSPGVPVTIAIGNNPGAGILTGTTSASTDVNGVATFDDLAVSQPGNGYTLIASSPGLADDTSDPFVVLPTFLGAAQSFSVLAGGALVNSGLTTISGDVGLSPGTSITDLPDGSVGGTIYVADDTADTAQEALLVAYEDLVSRPADADITDLSGVFTPGVYHSGSAIALNTTVTLDADNDPNAVWIFQVDRAMTTAADSSVILLNGARAANVFWVTARGVTTGANSTLYGNILTMGAITLGEGSVLIGRALSSDDVTLDGPTVRFTDAPAPTIAISGGPAATSTGAMPTIAGTSNAPESSPVTVRIAGQSLTTTVGSTGTWSVEATAIDAGTYDVVAKVRDAAGNGAAVTQVRTVEVNPDPVNLETASRFAVLATSVTNTDENMTVSGDMGVSLGPVDGFPPGVHLGTLETANPAAAGAQSDLAAAISEISARPAHTEIGGDLGGLTFHLGIHHQTAAMSLNGTVTLDAQGDPGALFIFVTDGAFTTVASGTVVLAGDAQAANVYWVVGGAVVTGAGTDLSGSILAVGAITLAAGTALSGRALSQDAVTMAAGAISLPNLAGRGVQEAVTESAESSPAVLVDVSEPAPVEENSTVATTPAPTTAPTTETTTETTQQITPPSTQQLSPETAPPPALETTPGLTVSTSPDPADYVPPTEPAPSLMTSADVSTEVTAP